MVSCDSVNASNLFPFIICCFQFFISSACKKAVQLYSLTFFCNNSITLIKGIKLSQLNSFIFSFTITVPTSEEEIWFFGHYFYVNVTAWRKSFHQSWDLIFHLKNDFPWLPTPVHIIKSVYNAILTLNSLISNCYCCGWLVDFV